MAKNNSTKQQGASDIHSKSKAEDLAVKGSSTGNKKPATYEEISAAAKKAGKQKQISQGFYSWEEEGQTLTGRLLEIKKVPSKDGDSEYNRYIMDTDEGLQGVSAGVTVDKMFNENDYVGQIVVIIYKGKISLQDGHSANNFDVFIIEE